MTSELQGAGQPGEPPLGSSAATRVGRPAGGLVLVRASIFRANAGQRIVAVGASRSAAPPMQRALERRARHVVDVICTRVRVIPTVVAQRRGSQSRRPRIEAPREVRRCRWGNPCLASLGLSDKPTAISRMPRTKRSARRRSRAARRAAVRTRWAIRASSRAAQPRPYRTDTHFRNARRSRRMGLRHRHAPIRHDVVPGGVRSSLASARMRHPGGARETPATNRAQSLRSLRSRASVLRTRGRRRT